MAILLPTLLRYWQLALICFRCQNNFSNLTIWDYIQRARVEKSYHEKTSTWLHTAILNLLLKSRGTDVNARVEYGNTLLALAAEEGDGYLVEAFLVREGIQASSRNNFNATPLALAAEKGHHRAVNLLAEAL